MRLLKFTVARYRQILALGAQLYLKAIRLYLANTVLLSQYYNRNPHKSTNIGTGPEGFEPSTNCSAGSHSIQTELWAQTFLIEFLI